MAERQAVETDLPSAGTSPEITETKSRTAGHGGPRWAIIGIFLILLFGALYLTSSFVLPVMIALLFALVLSPIVRLMRRRLKIPEPVSAIALVAGALMTLSLGFYMLSDPITDLVNNAPKYVSAVEGQLKTVRDRLDRPMVGCGTRGLRSPCSRPRSRVRIPGSRTPRSRGAVRVIRAACDLIGESEPARCGSERNSVV